MDQSKFVNYVIQLRHLKEDGFPALVSGYAASFTVIRSFHTFKESCPSQGTNHIVQRQTRVKEKKIVL